MSEILTIYDDERPIKTIDFGDENGGYTVGECKVTEIRPYYESGHMSNITWIAVFIGDEIIARVPSEKVSVHYAKETP